MSWYGFKPYLTVDQKRARGARHVAELAKAGKRIEPVRLNGRKFAETFWAKAWCDHIEKFGDYRSRLERGKAIVRNGSVMHLQIMPGEVEAIVAGSEVYELNIKIKPLMPAAWEAIREECRGQIGSLIELLQGKLAGGVMQVVTRQVGGLFPTPKDIQMECTCPDFAGVCKHLAAVMYAIGARLDSQPDLLFKLRQVDHLQLIEQADTAQLTDGGNHENVIDDAQLEDIFGIEMDVTPPDSTTEEPPADTRSKLNHPTRPKRAKASESDDD